jgi:hypothetical protein
LAAPPFLLLIGRTAKRKRCRENLSSQSKSGLCSFIEAKRTAKALQELCLLEEIAPRQLGVSLCFQPYNRNKRRSGDDLDSGYGRGNDDAARLFTRIGNGKAL